jgi:hypothetical protein
MDETKPYSTPDTLWEAWQTLFLMLKDMSMNMMTHEHETKISRPRLSIDRLRRQTLSLAALLPVSSTAERKRWLVAQICTPSGSLTLAKFRDLCFHDPEFARWAWASFSSAIRAVAMRDGVPHIASFSLVSAGNAYQAKHILTKTVYVGLVTDSARWEHAVRAMFAMAGIRIQCSIMPFYEPDVLVHTPTSAASDLAKYECARRLCIGSRAGSGLYTFFLDTDAIDGPRPTLARSSPAPRWALDAPRLGVSASSIVQTLQRQTRALYPNKTEFCAYLEHAGSPKRHAWFDRLSAYLPVTALGWDRGGIQRGDRHELLAPAHAMKAFERYRFVLIVEDEDRSPGVALVSALLAGCVPLYAGSADVLRYFSLDAVMLLQEKDRDMSVHHVAAVDADMAARLKMQMSPALTSLGEQSLLDPDWAYHALGALFGVDSLPEVPEAKPEAKLVPPATPATSTATPVEDTPATPATSTATPVEDTHATPATSSATPVEDTHATPADPPVTEAPATSLDSKSKIE